MAGSAFASSKAKLGRLASNIDGVRERSKVGKADQKDAVEREGESDQRDEDYFDWRMEDLAVNGNKRLHLVM